MWRKSLEKPTITSKLRVVMTAMWHPKEPNQPTLNSGFGAHT